MANIYKFPQETIPFHEFLEDLKQSYDEDRLNDFICIYEFGYKKGEEIKGFVAGINKYWFGSSSTKSLGLCQIMIKYILDWIVEKNEELDG